jgi:hypothetical protein
VEGSERLVRNAAGAALLAVATVANAAVSLTTSYAPGVNPELRLDLQTDTPFANVAVLDLFLHDFSDELVLVGVTPSFVPRRVLGSGDPAFPGYSFQGPPYPTLDGLLVRWSFEAPASGGPFDFTVSGLVTFGDETTVRFAAVGSAAPIPEPSTWVLFATGGLAALVMVRRRRIRA